MLENLIVALIVGASTWYTLRKYVFKPKKSSVGCGSGCSSCGSCESAPAAPPGQRVIKLHRAA
jgi:hypothetical protein